ncbi:MAG TPA: acyl carrier protein [Thermoanaerobaculia bacterium]|nr:acyl carrier protein [Thermoanaerobaculia bacterium]
MDALTTKAPVPQEHDLPKEVWENVVRFLLEQSDAEIQPTALRPETSLRDELALTSLQAIEAIMCLEDEYHITIADQELATLETVGDVVRLMAVKTGAGAGETAAT